MNMEKALKNSVISVAGQILTFALKFIDRRLFVLFLDIEFLGYQSLFGNIFSLLSVAEFGISNIISFHLYKELADDNKKEIGKLVYLYKWIYRMIAFVVLVVGVACGFLIPYIVRNPEKPWSYLYLVYYLQLVSIVIGYLFSYKRTIYIADQKEYKCVQIDLYTTVLIQIAQLAVLVLTKDYILYLVIHLSSSILADIVISRKVSADYPYLDRKYTISKKDIEQRNLFSDIKNFVVHKICYTVYGGTDNIVISAFCGIRDVAIYGNYFLLQQGVMQILFYKLLNPIQATIGNIIYSKRSKKELWNQFQILDVFSFYFACYISMGFLVFFQPTIQVWMGKDHMLSMSFVVAYSISIYFLSVWEIVYKYRAVFGDYAQDRNCMILSAVMNVAVSIVCVRIWGVTGVQIGTLMAFLPIAYGRIRFVVHDHFGQSLGRYLGKHMLLAGVALIEGLVCYVLTRDLEISFGGFLARGIIWAVVPLLGNLALYWKNPYFKELCGYIKKLLIIVRDKALKHGTVG